MLKRPIIFAIGSKSFLVKLRVRPINDFLEVIRTINERILELEGRIMEIAGEMGKPSY